MASVRCPECDHRERIPADYERATIRCSECGVKIPLEEDEEEEERPRPVKKPKKKAKPAKSFWTPWVAAAGRLDTTLKVIVGLAMVAALGGCIHPAVPILYGSLLILFGGLVFLMVVFNDSPVELLLCFFVPFYSLYYLITHWDETKASLYLQLFGVVVSMSFLCGLPVHLAIMGTKSSFGNMARNNAPPPNDGLAPKDGAMPKDRPPEFPPPPKKDRPPEFPPPPPPKDRPPEFPPPKKKEPPPPPAKVTGDPKLDKLLDDLGSEDFFSSQNASLGLIAMKADPHRPAVMRKLHELLQKDDRGTRERVLSVMKVWATRQDTPAILAYLEQPNSHLKGLAIETLSELRDERAIDLLASCLTEFGLQSHAGKALRKIGPAAEPAMLKLLADEKKSSSHSEAVKILEMIGTKQSIPTLQFIATKGRGLARLQAPMAIKAIEARGMK